MHVLYGHRLSSVLVGGFASICFPRFSILPFWVVNLCSPVCRLDMRVMVYGPSIYVCRVCGHVRTPPIRGSASS
jgi:hypothetical protein